MRIKIGVPTPNSNFIPFFAKDYLKALEMGLSQGGVLDYELFPEPCGYCAQKEVVADKVQALLLKQQVDVVVMPLNTGLFEHVSSYFSAQQTPLIITTMGEDVIPPASRNPYLFTNTFNLWRSAWMAGYRGAAKFGKNACTSSGFHDGGYGLSFAFALGVEAQGGKILQAAVTHREARDEDPTETIRMLADKKPDFIMGLYSGKEAISYLGAFRECADHIPLMGLAPLADPSVLAEAGADARGIESVCCRPLTCDAYDSFANAFLKDTGRLPNPYALMAYESARLLSLAAERLEGSEPPPGELARALSVASFDGPRGRVSFDNEVAEVETLDYLSEVSIDENGKAVQSGLGKLEAPPIFYEQLDLARKKLTKHGWLNPYLIA